MRSKLDKHERFIRNCLSIGFTQREIARHLNCTEATLSKWMQRMKRKWRRKAKKYAARLWWSYDR